MECRVEAIDTSLQSVHVFLHQDKRRSVSMFMNANEPVQVGLAAANVHIDLAMMRHVHHVFFLPSSPLDPPPKPDFQAFSLLPPLNLHIKGSLHLSLCDSSLSTPLHVSLTNIQVDLLGQTPNMLLQDTSSPLLSIVDPPFYDCVPLPLRKLSINTQLCVSTKSIMYLSREEDQTSSTSLDIKVDVEQGLDSLDVVVDIPHYAYFNLDPMLNLQNVDMEFLKDPHAPAIEYTYPTTLSCKIQVEDLHLEGLEQEDLRKQGVQGEVNKMYFKVEKGEEGVQGRVLCKRLAMKGVQVEDMDVRVEDTTRVAIKMDFVHVGVEKVMEVMEKVDSITPSPSSTPSPPTSSIIQPSPPIPPSTLDISSSPMKLTFDLPFLGVKYQDNDIEVTSLYVYVEGTYPSSVMCGVDLFVEVKPLLKGEMFGEMKPLLKGEFHVDGTIEHANSCQFKTSHTSFLLFDSNIRVYPKDCEIECRLEEEALVTRKHVVLHMSPSVEVWNQAWEPVMEPFSLCLTVETPQKRTLSSVSPCLYSVDVSTSESIRFNLTPHLVYVVSMLQNGYTPTNTANSHLFQEEDLTNLRLINQTGSSVDVQVLEYYDTYESFRVCVNESPMDVQVCLFGVVLKKKRETVVIGLEQVSRVELVHAGMLEVVLVVGEDQLVLECMCVEDKSRLVSQICLAMQHQDKQASSLLFQGGRLRVGGEEVHVSLSIGRLLLDCGGYSDLQSASPHSTSYSTISRPSHESPPSHIHPILPLNTPTPSKSILLNNSIFLQTEGSCFEVQSPEETIIFTALTPHHARVWGKVICDAILLHTPTHSFEDSSTNMSSAVNSTFKGSTPALDTSIPVHTLDVGQSIPYTPQGFLKVTSQHEFFSQIINLRQIHHQSSIQGPFRVSAACVDQVELTSSHSITNNTSNPLSFKCLSPSNDFSAPIWGYLFDRHECEVQVRLVSSEWDKPEVISLGKGLYVFPRPILISEMKIMGWNVADTRPTPLVLRDTMDMVLPGHSSPLPVSFLHHIPILISSPNIWALECDVDSVLSPFMSIHVQAQDHMTNLSVYTRLQVDNQSPFPFYLDNVYFSSLESMVHPYQDVMCLSRFQEDVEEDEVVEVDMGAVEVGDTIEVGTLFTVLKQRQGLGIKLVVYVQALVRNLSGLVSLYLRTTPSVPFQVCPSSGNFPLRGDKIQVSSSLASVRAETFSLLVGTAGVVCLEGGVSVCVEVVQSEDFSNTLEVLLTPSFTCTNSTPLNISIRVAERIYPCDQAHLLNIDQHSPFTLCLDNTYTSSSITLESSPLDEAFLISLDPIDTAPFLSLDLSNPSTTPISLSSPDPPESPHSLASSHDIYSVTEKNTLRDVFPWPVGPFTIDFSRIPAIGVKIRTFRTGACRLEVVDVGQVDDIMEWANYTQGYRVCVDGCSFVAPQQGVFLGVQEEYECLVVQIGTGEVRECVLRVYACVTFRNGASIALLREKKSISISCVLDSVSNSHVSTPSSLSPSSLLLSPCRRPRGNFTSPKTPLERIHRDELKVISTRHVGSMVCLGEMSCVSPPHTSISLPHTSTSLPHTSTSPLPPVFWRPVPQSDATIDLYCGQTKVASFKWRRLFMDSWVRFQYQGKVYESRLTTKQHIHDIRCQFKEVREEVRKVSKPDAREEEKQPTVQVDDGFRQWELVLDTLTSSQGEVYCVVTSSHSPEVYRSSASCTRGWAQEVVVLDTDIEAVHEVTLYQSRQSKQDPYLQYLFGEEDVDETLMVARSSLPRHADDVCLGSCVLGEGRGITPFGLVYELRYTYSVVQNKVLLVGLTMGFSLGFR